MHFASPPCRQTERDGLQSQTHSDTRQKNERDLVTASYSVQQSILHCARAALVPVQDTFMLHGTRVSLDHGSFFSRFALVRLFIVKCSGCASQLKAAVLLLFVLIPTLSHTSTTYLLLGKITSKTLCTCFFSSGTVLSHSQNFHHGAKLVTFDCSLC